jgi:CheY-like chemotaxis protein
MDLFRRRAMGPSGPSDLKRSAPALFPQPETNSSEAAQAASFAHSHPTSASTKDIALAALNGLRILLAEDHEVNAHLLIEELEHYGANISHVLEGESACVQALAMPRPQVVLMDCQMPGVDGFEAARRIRLAEAQRGLAPVPIVALTGLSREFEQEHSFSAGMDAYLVKPFSSKQLAQTIFEVTGITHEAERLRDSA